MIPNTVALEEYLKPLEFALLDDAVNEILINQPQTVFVEKQGAFVRHDIRALDQKHLLGLAHLIARYSEQRFSEQEPLLSGTLPSGHRLQMICPPATRSECVIICIRKQSLRDIGLDDLAGQGLFDCAKRYQGMGTNGDVDVKDELEELLLEGRFVDFLKSAIRLKKNILISGATSTGKTTFLNACLKEVPLHEHLVTLEDVFEVKPPHEKHTALLSSKGLQGLASITMQDLVQASLRLRPDRIILGELRGAEAADFINATATGHDGALSSIHASSPSTAFMRLTHMVKLSGLALSREDILMDLHTVIDSVVQLKRVYADGKLLRQVTDIYYRGAKDDGNIFPV